MSDPVDRFAEAAQEYIEWCEAPSADVSAPQELRTLLVHLSDRALALELPRSPSEETEGKETSRDEWQAVYDRCSALPFQYYSEPCDPLSVPAEEVSVVGDLADDVADIHRDLVRGLSLYVAGHKIEAEWQWRFTFDSHWGRHASSAIRALTTVGTPDPSATACY